MTEVYSHSRLSTFEQCPFRFKLRYIDKIKPEISQSIEAFLGSCVHNTLEWLYNLVKDENIIPELNKTIKYYSEEWEANYDPKIKIVSNELTASDYFNKGVEFLLSYYTKHHPFADGTIECEKKITIDLDEEGEYKIQGFIDRFVYNKEEDAYEVHDYKTAKTLPTQEKMDQDRQLALYSIAVKETYGRDKEVKLIWHYLAHNTSIISKRTNQQLKELKEKTLNQIKEIENTEDFPTCKGILCNWCEYKEMCPEFGGTPPASKKEKREIAKDFPTLSKYLRK